MRNKIEVNNIIKKIGNTVILNNLSFEIPKGQISALLGPNGAGKTTCLRVLANLSDIDSGDIRICDNSEKINRTKHGVIYINDSPLLYDILTGYEYLQFVSDIYKIKIEDIKIETLVHRFKLENYIYKPTLQYSLGMKKKLVLMSALLINPQVLLLDEFISGIDPINLKDVKDILIDYVSEGNTVVLSTHQLEVAQTFCNHIIMINEGKLIKTGISIERILEENDSLENFFIKSIFEVN
ncbi:MAG: ABC transporter ATP-binding protein [Carnobacterium alterfunditum]